MFKLNQRYIRYFHIVRIFVSDRLKVQYRRSALGFLWSSLGPLLMLVVLTTVFSAIFNRPFFEFLLFLFAGYMPWRFFSTTITGATQYVVGKEGLIRRVPLPIILFPITLATSSMVDFILGSVFFFIILVAVMGNVSVALVILPLSVILLYFFILGASMIIATVGVYFRDTNQIITLLIRGLFYASPILYDVEILELRFGKTEGLTHDILMTTLAYNPISYFVELFRAPICYGEFPEPLSLLIAITVTIVTFLIGFTLFNAFRHAFIFRL